MTLELAVFGLLLLGAGYFVMREWVAREEIDSNKWPVASDASQVLLFISGDILLTLGVVCLVGAVGGSPA